MEMENVYYNTALTEAILDPANYSYRDRNWRAPKVEDTSTVIFDEPGRVLPQAPYGRNGVDCRSHYFRVSKAQFGGFFLHVQHGGGEETWKLDYDRHSIDALGALDSDARYRLLWVIMQAHHDSAHTAQAKEAAYWREAAASKRIRTRKMPGRNEVKVWVETAAQEGN